MLRQEIAVLYRIDAQSEAFEDALSAASIPYVLRGGERFFDRPEVKQAVLLLRGAARASDDAHVVHEVSDVLASLGWDAEQPPSGGASRERWESLAALHRLAQDYVVGHAEGSLRGLVQELDERAAAQHAPTVQGVTLASLHAAKGLEWDAVFVVGLVEGMLPLVHAQTDAAVEEERRLLYVGVTRAREHLTLSWAWARSPGGARTRRPSRFLDGMRPAESGGRGAPRKRPKSGRSRGRLETNCMTCGGALISAAERKRGRCAGCPPGYDEGLFDDLKTWRLARARADSVPAFVVFTDATLEAIAMKKPSTLSDLASISGVGATKLDRYGSSVIAVVEGGSGSADPDELD